MENASKALIIAGAILLAILLISLGIYIFNQASDTINKSGMTQAETKTFNQNFTKYEGKQKGSAIRSMVQDVLANNNSDEASDETMVSINVANFSMQPTGTASLVSLAPGTNQSPSINVKNTVTYTVSFQYKNGRVAIIDVE